MRSKYNVDADKARRTHEGIVFDSVMEMKFYRDVVLPAYRSGEICEYELQKKYELQPKFRRGDKTILPITYVADFYLRYADGREEVIDIKGCPDTTAKLKRKLFWHVYPDTEYRWLTHIQKYGGWIEYEQAEEFRREARKKRKAAQTAAEDEEVNEHGEEG